MNDIDKAAMEYFVIMGDSNPLPEDVKCLTEIIGEQVEEAHASHKVICIQETCPNWAGYASNRCLDCKHRIDRELIAQFEAALKISEEENKQWKEKDRVARGDPRRAAIFDWLNEHTDENVKTISDQNGVMENQVAKLEAHLENVHELVSAELEEPKEKRSWERLGRLYYAAHERMQ